MIVADSSVWIDFFKGYVTPAVSQLLELIDQQKVLVGDIVLCEVLRGARSDQHARTLELTMRRCELAPMLGTDIAIAAAESYRRLRSRGFTMHKTTDVIIGTYCIANGHTLLHSDRDFEPMERLLGLKVLSTGFKVNEPVPAYG